MRVVIVGATGNVGTSVATAVRDDRSVDHVIGLARRLPDAGDDGIEWRRADIAVDDLTRHFRGADAVVHLAWLLQPTRNRRLLHEVNVLGSGRVFEAAAKAGVGALLYASSAGAYSPAPDGAPVDESWATGGVPTSTYSRQKVRVERMLDDFEERHPFVRVVRLRPSLTFKATAATEIRRLFLGRLVPVLLGPVSRLRTVPDVPGLSIQAVHSDDVAEAYRLALLGSVTGAYNIAADSIIDAGTAAEHFGLHRMPIDAKLARSALAIGWRLHLQPTEPGWFDLARRSPLLRTDRARDELGWCPRRHSLDLIEEMAQAIIDGSDRPGPPLGRIGGLARA